MSWFVNVMSPIWAKLRLNSALSSGYSAGSSACNKSFSRCPTLRAMRIRKDVRAVESVMLATQPPRVCISRCASRFSTAEWDVGAALAHAQALLGTAIGAARPDGAHQIEQRVARGSGSQRAPEVRAVLRVETEQQHAVGGQSRPVARAAERLRCRRNDAES